jgi:hypothetical protein
MIFRSARSSDPDRPRANFIVAMKPELLSSASKAKMSLLANPAMAPLARALGMIRKVLRSKVTAVSPRLPLQP